MRWEDALKPYTKIMEGKVKEDRACERYIEERFRISL